MARLFAALLLAVILGGCGGRSGDGGSAASGQSANFSSGPGPALAVSTTAFNDAFTCFAGADPVRSGAVLLVHGTGLTAAESWDNTYAALLPPAGYNVCTIQLPDRALDDIQIASEYVVAAIRRMAVDFDGKIDVITHSQGGLEARWAIKYWPDIRTKLDDVIMLAAPNHGTETANALCLQPLLGCTAAIRQQEIGSNFLTALNSGDETPGDLSYTSIYSILGDAIVLNTIPNAAAGGKPTSAIDGATNIAVQSLCGTDLVVDHIELLYNATAYFIALDALDHPGPADPDRVQTNCLAFIAPGITLTGALDTEATYLAALGAVASNPAVPEPPLMAYAR